MPRIFTEPLYSLDGLFQIGFSLHLQRWFLFIRNHNAECPQQLWIVFKRHLGNLLLWSTALSSTRHGRITRISTHAGDNLTYQLDEVPL
ncbi:MAG: hypothetical protein AAF944_22965 [Bacteroidota bacterium]